MFWDSQTFLLPSFCKPKPKERHQPRKKEKKTIANPFCSLQRYLMLIVYVLDRFGGTLMAVKRLIKFVICVGVFLSVCQFLVVHLMLGF